MAEFDFGSCDRGRSIFEDLIASYPKRSDLWHVYVDREAKSGHIQEARQLYERILSVFMTSSTSSSASTTVAKNMKNAFKKYLSFEIVNGTVEQQEEVKRKAREYVKSLA